MSTTTATPAPIGNGNAAADRLAGRLFALVGATFLAAVVGAGLLDAAGMPEGTPARALLGLVAAAGGVLAVSRAWSR